jgi:tRNA-2-methylthio-N6-dimethylallyladenosine synthase
VADPEPRRYLIRTFGCQMNEHDSERLAGQLEADGMVPATGVDDADVVVLNTCCIRENADNKLYGHLGMLKAVKDARPDLQIGVGGCLAQKDGGLIQERAPWVDAVWGTHNVGRAARLLASALDGGAPVLELWDRPSADIDEDQVTGMALRRDHPWAAWVTIQVGCDNSCAFCIVPSVRGGEISRPFGKVIAEVERLAATGVSEVTLLGQNVNSYGRDLTTRLRLDPDRSSSAAVTGSVWASGEQHRSRPLFADLLRAVARVDGIRRVRYTSPHPKDLRPETIDVMATEAAVCPQLHLPLQAGSDRVLARMRRGYTAERYLERLGAARAAIGDLAVTTDLIVGFPGETEDDFEQTLAVVAEASYDSAYTFLYSPRPGTEAATWVDQFVPAEVTADRFARLRVVVERAALQHHRARIGRVEEVLVEGPSKRDPAMTTGRTRQGKLVHFRAASTGSASTGSASTGSASTGSASTGSASTGSASTGSASGDPAPGARPGSTVEVRVVGAAPHHLTGELLEVTAAPRHRTRIPVVAG